MNTPIRAGAVIFIDRVVFDDDEMTLALRLEDVALKLNGDAQTPVAALIKSGALDLSNPGNLVGFMPNRNPVIAEAKDNRIVLDLMRDPRIGQNPMVAFTGGSAHLVRDAARHRERRRPSGNRVPRAPHRLSRSRPQLPAPCDHARNRQAPASLSAKRRSVPTASVGGVGP